jgi:hypothetical protein
VPGQDDDDDAILKRRNLLIALALSGATIATGAGVSACACLSAFDAGQTEDAGPDASDE